jgi:hypothetical protein
VNSSRSRSEPICTYSQYRELSQTNHTMWGPYQTMMTPRKAFSTRSLRLSSAGSNGCFASRPVLQELHEVLRPAARTAVAHDPLLQRHWRRESSHHFELCREISTANRPLFGGQKSRATYISQNDTFNHNLHVCSAVTSIVVTRGRHLPRTCPPCTHSTVPCGAAWSVSRLSTG